MKRAVLVLVVLALLTIAAIWWLSSTVKELR
jgi:hypothetical protein